MNSKVASIFCYCGLIFWLIALLTCESKQELSKNLSQGLIVSIALCIPVVCIAGIVFAIMAIVRICKGEESPELPLIGNLDFFNK